jgi:hypothetical protein
MPPKLTYWVRSKQTNEIGGFGLTPVPAQFKTLEEAKLYRRRLNLHRGAYHPGYVVEKQDDSPPAGFFPMEIPGTGKIVIKRA